MNDDSSTVLMPGYGVFLQVEPGTPGAFFLFVDDVEMCLLPLRD